MAPIQRFTLPGCRIEKIATPMQGFRKPGRMLPWIWSASRIGSSSTGAPLTEAVPDDAGARRTSAGGSGPAGRPPGEGGPAGGRAVLVQRVDREVGARRLVLAARPAARHRGVAEAPRLHGQGDQVH